MGPVYINLDAEMQEAKLAEPLPPIDAARFMPQPTRGIARSGPAGRRDAQGAKHPVILIGRVSRSVEGWNERVALAETLNAKVITDLKCAAGFPTDHPLHAGVPAGNALDPTAAEALKNADVILALDLIDLNGVPARRLRLRPAEGQDHQCQRRLPHP